MKRSISYGLSLILVNIRNSMSNRYAFLFQSVSMLGNHLIFFMIWVLFFNSFKEVNGWRLVHMALLYSVFCLGYGLSVVLFGGYRKLSLIISEGELDSYLTHPRNLLLNICCSRSTASGWGDIFAGLILVCFAGVNVLSNFPVFTIVILCIMLLLVSCGVIIGSLAFWMGKIEHLSLQLFECVVTFSLYPQSIHTGVSKILIFTVIPAGFIGFLPVVLLRDFKSSTFLFLVSGTAFYAALAYKMFFYGLKKYRSGNLFVNRSY